jgi:hypothetical protein
MPKKSDEVTPKKPADEGVLVSAAKTIGKAAGTVAAFAGLESPAAPEKTAPAGKLQKKDKTHLPRRVKKAQKKAAASQL